MTKDYTEAIEHNHAKGEYIARVESKRALTIKEWRKLNTKLAEAIQILKEGEK